MVTLGSLYHADGSPNTYHTASLIGVATAPSWRGPYSSASEFGGPISNFQYPFDENECVPPRSYPSQFTDEHSAILLTKAHSQP